MKPSFRPEVIAQLGQTAHQSSPYSQIKHFANVGGFPKDLADPYMVYGSARSFGKSPTQAKMFYFRVSRVNVGATLSGVTVTAVTSL